MKIKTFNSVCLVALLSISFICPASTGGRGDFESSKVIAADDGFVDLLTDPIELDDIITPQTESLAPTGKIKYSCSPVGNGLDDGFFSLEVFKGKLYAGGFGYNKKPSLFSYPSWQVVKPGLVITESVCDMREFKGYLYANTELDGKIYRSSNGNNWQQVFKDGSIGCVLREYKGYLYATIHKGVLAKGGKIYRTANGTNWEKVFDSGTVNDHRMKELIVFNDVLYALSINNSNKVGGYFTTTNGTNWTWHPVGNVRLFKGMVLPATSQITPKGLWMTSTAANSNGGPSGLWVLQNDHKLVHIKDFPGNTHLGELIMFNNHIFFTATKQWKGKQGGASLWMSGKDATQWTQVCTFRETEAWNLAIYNKQLYITTKQDGGKGALGKVYRFNTITTPI